MIKNNEIWVQWIIESDNFSPKKEKVHIDDILSKIAYPNKEIIKRAIKRQGGGWYFVEESDNYILYKYGYTKCFPKVFKYVYFIKTKLSFPENII
jgi:hypothetical protein